MHSSWMRPWCAGHYVQLELSRRVSRIDCVVGAGLVFLQGRRCGVACLRLKSAAQELPVATTQRMEAGFQPVSTCREYSCNVFLTDIDVSQTPCSSARRRTKSQNCGCCAAKLRDIGIDSSAALQVRSDLDEQGRCERFLVATHERIVSVAGRLPLPLTQFSELRANLSALISMPAQRLLFGGDVNRGRATALEARCACRQRSGSNRSTSHLMDAGERPLLMGL
jgi:hypothetical protein